MRQTRRRTGGPSARKLSANWQVHERARVAGELCLDSGQGMPGFGVPQLEGDDGDRPSTGEPAPEVGFVVGDVQRETQLERSGQQRRGRRVARRSTAVRNAVEQDVNRTRRVGTEGRGARGLGRRRRSSPGSPRSPAHIAAQSASRYVARARSASSGLQAPGRAEQQPGRVAGRVAAPTRSVRAAAPPRQPQGVERPGLDRDQQPQGRIQRAGSEAWPGPPPAGAGLRRAGSGVSIDRPLAGTRPPRPGRRAPWARPAERSSSAATSSSGPGAACARCQARRSGSMLRIGRPAASARCTACRSWQRRRPVGRRAHQRMPETARWAPNSSRPASAAGVAAAAGIPSRPAAATPAPGRRPARPPRPAAAAGSSAGSASSRRRKLVLDPARRAASRRAARTRPPAPPVSSPAAAPAAPAGCRASRRRSGRGPGASSGPVSTASSSARGVGLLQALDHQLRQPRQLVARTRAPRTPAPTDSAARRRATNPSDLRRGLVQPLLVIHQADQRVLVGDLGQQAQRGQPDQEPVRRRARPRPNAVRSACTLGSRQALEAVQHRRAQLVQPGEGELHLRLDTDGARHPAARRAARPGSPAAPSCPRPAPRAPPGPGSHRREPRRGAGRARRIRGAGPAAPRRVPAGREGRRPPGTDTTPLSTTAAACPAARRQPPGHPDQGLDERSGSMHEEVVICHAASNPIQAQHSYFRAAPHAGLSNT